MVYLKLVRETYKEAIALNPRINSDLRAALRAHERMPLFLQNLAKELEIVQADRVNKWKKPYTEKNIKDLIYDMVEVFISGVELEANARRESDIKKKMAEYKAQQQKDLDATAAGDISGDYQDIFTEGGITATDERSV